MIAIVPGWTCSLTQIHKAKGTFSLQQEDSSFSAGTRAVRPTAAEAIYEQEGNQPEDLEETRSQAGILFTWCL